MKSPRKVRSWDTDEEFLKDQVENTTCSSQDRMGWAESAADKFIIYGRILRGMGQLFHDDVVADFGGNDGYAANEFYKVMAIKPIVVDCEPKRVMYARQVYGLPAVQAFLEDLTMPDKSVDWGFCSHTLEHTRDTLKALKEMARVIKRGCFFVIPIESYEHTILNKAHAVHARSMSEWVSVIKAAGWRIIGKRRHCKHECAIYAVPR